MLEGHRTEREEPEREKQKYKYKMKLYLCHGYCPIFGTVRETIQATGLADAKAQFWKKHRLQALYITPTKL